MGLLTTFRPVLMATNEDHQYVILVPVFLGTQHGPSQFTLELCASDGESSAAFRKSDYSRCL